jgi:hypothetical protein
MKIARAVARPASIERAVFQELHHKEKVAPAPPVMPELARVAVALRKVCPFEGTLCGEGMRACWGKIQDEAISLAKSEPFLASTVTNSIVKHDTFGSGLSHVLSHQLTKATSPEISFDEWYNLLNELYSSRQLYDPMFEMPLECMGMFDLLSIIERDPAADGLLLNPFLNFKGYKAMQMHRVAHVLWRTGRKELAELIQSKCAEAFAIDIHPAARIDRGLMIDHGTGIVIGETTSKRFIHTFPSRIAAPISSSTHHYHTLHLIAYKCFLILCILLQSLLICCTATASRSLRAGLQLLCGCFVLGLRLLFDWLCNRLKNHRFAIHYQLLRIRFASTSYSICNCSCSEFALQPLCDCFATALQLLYVRFATALQLLCARVATVLKSL